MTYRNGPGLSEYHLYSAVAWSYYSLEMMDKVEPPSIPDGYGISIAYACLLDIIRSISLLVATETEGTCNYLITKDALCLI